MVDVSAGDPINADDYSGTLNDLTDRVTTLESQAEDVQELWPKCRVATPVAATISTETEQPLAFDVAPYNQGGIHPGGTSSTLTLPRDGVYLLVAYALWTTISTTGVRRLTLRRNGVADVVSLAPEGLGGQIVPVNVSAVAFFNTGETLQAAVWQDSGMDLDVAGWLTVTYMGTVPT